MSSETDDEPGADPAKPKADLAKAAGAKNKPAGPKDKRKKLLVIGGAVAALALAGGGGAFMLSGGKAEAEAGDHAAPAAAEHGGEAGEEGHDGAAAKPLDVPPLLVNLRSGDGAPHFLKVHVMLMPGDGVTAEALQEQLPMLLDSYQPFLRELRPEDLSGSAAVFRIKEELLVRAREAIGAGKVKDVLIQDLIQQ